VLIECRARRGHSVVADCRDGCTYIRTFIVKLLLGSLPLIMHVCGVSGQVTMTGI
jgi:hypothetical protein